MDKLPHKYQNESVQELLDIYLKEGDELAFYELYRRHSDKLMGFFMKKCGGDRSLCKDLIQDTYLELLLSKSFKGNTIREFGKYMMRIGLNVCSKHFKKNKKRKENELERQRTHHDEFDDTDENLNREELLADIELKIRQLPSDDQATAIELWMIGKTYQEIAEIMGKTVSEVTNLIYRAKKNLGGK